MIEITTCKEEYNINLSVLNRLNKYTISNLAIASKTLIYAYTLIRSYETIIAFSGALNNANTNMNIVDWYTQFAANILSHGISNLLFKNHKPTVSPTAITISEKINSILTETENNSWSLELFNLPNSML